MENTNSLENKTPLIDAILAGNLSPVNAAIRSSLHAQYASAVSCVHVEKKD